MAPNQSTFNFGNLTFDGSVSTNRGGGKYVQVAYQGTQVVFQLGTSVHDTLRTPFGAEYAAKDDPTSGFVMKVELTPEIQAFIEQFEAKTVEAANKHSQAWFGKPTPNAMHNSTVKEQNGDRPPCLKLKIATEGSRPTSVQVATLTDGKLSKPTTGTVDDIKPGSSVLPIVRLQGGVYFINRTYGCSLVADAVLVIKDHGSASRSSVTFDLGDDIIMLDDE